MRTSERATLDHCPHCGGLLDEPRGRPRSRPQHCRLFGLVTVLHHHWPESHWFRPKSADHLRYWLTHRAGRSDVVKSIRVQSVDPAHLEALLKAVLQTSDDERTFVEMDGELITVSKAHSIVTRGPKAMPQREFALLCSDIDELVKAETGIEPDELLREHEKAA